MEERLKILVIGAGIIGIHCALQQQKRRPDAAILVIDRSPFSYDGASSGNMAGFATCEVQPLATLANVARGVSWMMNPLAPFTLRPSSLPILIPWLRGFVKAAMTPGHFAHVVAAQESLMSRAYDAHIDVIGDTPLRTLISTQGALALYKSPQRLQRDWNNRWRLFRARGEACHKLGGAELKQKLPDLDSRIEYAIHIPSIRYWTDPAILLAGLHDLARRRGIDIRIGDISKIELQEDNSSSVWLNEGESIGFDKLVIAAGAWSKSLCQFIGDKVPLDTERGYATTLSAAGVSIHHLLLFPDDEFVATPLTAGLRLGGTVELAGLEAPPNYQRTDLLARKIKDYFPSINTSVRKSWMGHRPSTPDGLPVIGVSPRASNVFYAFGHGHVGMTQSAITGKLIAQMLCKEPPEVDIAPFNIGRFD